LVQTIASIPRRFTFEVLLKTELPRARHEIMDVLGVLEQREDGLLLRGTIDDIDWLARQLARLSFDFVVHEPQELRTALLRRADELRSLAEAV